MTRRLKPFFLLTGALLLVSALAVRPAQAQKKADQAKIKEPDVVAAVNGLSCPFCAYGLEKKLKGLDGVTDVVVLLEKGKVQLKVAEGTTLSKKKIKKATKDAGFTAKKITFPDESARASSSG
ncbi:MAG: heavy-metal-associated domain-containing protein [Salinibacter sp.]